MSTRRSNKPAASPDKRDRLSDTIYAQLVARLYGVGPRVLAASVFGIALIGGAATLKTGDVLLGLLTLTACVSALALMVLVTVRPADVAELSAAEARRSERLYRRPSLVLSAALGATCARGFWISDDPVVHLLLVSLASSAMTVVLRNHFRPRLVVMQLGLLAVPAAAAMAGRDQLLYWVLAVGALVLAYSIARTALSLYHETRESLRKDERIVRQHRRFQAALNNMAQGLCMFDANLRLLVSNTRYLEMYGFSPAVVKPGISLRRLLEHSVDVGNHAGVTVDQFYESIAGQLAQQQPSIHHNVLENGRTIAISYMPMPEGGCVATHEDITDRKAAEAQIAYLARHDALSDLPNRLLFREKLDEALAATRRAGQVAVLCLDLDRFKAVNDTLGHPVGDGLLQEAARRLKGCVRDTDVVARLGGDEFAIVQNGADQPHAATALAERVIQVVSAPYEVGGHQINIGASIGVSIAPDDSGDPDQLLRNADLALYRAKIEGRGQHRFFASEMDERMQARRSLELDLRHALGNGEFHLVYQPLVTVATGDIIGFEALLRWKHPKRGLVMPTEFIALSEEIGLIGTLGEWVLREACSTAALWPDGIGVAVNLSPLQFKSGNLTSTVMMALASSGIRPERLELEITEGVLLTDSEATLEVLHSLRRLGVRIAMDDFGTGYSSLSYLRAFPFDKIKIDRSFFRDIFSDRDALAIVRAVTDLGKSLGMTTTAEGIETEEQLDQLRVQGCTEVQGYLLGRPMPAKAATKLVMAQTGAQAARA